MDDPIPEEMDYLEKNGVDVRAYRVKFQQKQQAFLERNRARHAQQAAAHMDQSLILVSGVLLLDMLMNQKPPEDNLNGLNLSAQKCQSDIAANITGSRVVKMFNGYPTSCW